MKANKKREQQVLTKQMKAKKKEKNIQKQAHVHKSGLGRCKQRQPNKTKK